MFKNSDYMRERNQFLKDKSAERAKLTKITKDNIELENKLEDSLAQIKDYEEIFKRHETKVQELKNEYMNRLKPNMNASNYDYKKLFLYLTEKIESLYDCPLSCEKLVNPTVLPSGVTVNEKFFNKLLKSNSMDPFDKKLGINNRKSEILILEILS